ncbi:MAG: hypothetical protein ACI4QT_10360 [Kiritimatiellia bacterium]
MRGILRCHTGRSAVVSPLIILLLVLIAGVGSFALWPMYQKVRNAVRIDMAARALAQCAKVLAIHPELAVENDNEATIREVTAYLRKHEEQIPVWPEETLRDTFDFSCPTNPMVKVELTGGPAWITLASNQVERLY